MLEFISELDFTVVKVVGMVLSGLSGIIMSWISKRSVNYRKIDKRVVLAIVLYFVYLNGLAIVFSFVFGIVVIFVPLYEMMSAVLVSLFMAIVLIGLFWGLIIRTKRIKVMMDKAKEIGKPLFLLINGISIYSVLAGFVYAAFVLFEQGDLLLPRVLHALDWGLLVVWFALIVALVWGSAKYIFAEMKVTLVDGEVIKYSCSPQMCRVHKNYLRLLKRDEKGTIVYERHINEGSIKQIEYS